MNPTQNESTRRLAVAEIITSEAVHVTTSQRMSAVMSALDSLAAGHTAHRALSTGRAVLNQQAAAI